MIEHLGLIPDGSRRWAVSQKMDYDTSYLLAMDKIVEMVRCAQQLQIPQMSLYLLSKENLRRSQADLDAVFRAETCFFADKLPGFCHAQACQVIPVGDLSAIPEAYAQAVQQLAAETHHFDKMKLYTLVAYHPEDEIRAALRKLKDPESFSLKDLAVPVPLDLIIRTGGGDPLMSNFLPLQSAYAPILMRDEMFNDLTLETFEALILKAARQQHLKGR